MPKKLKECIRLNKGNYKFIDQLLHNYNLELYITSGSTGYPLEIIRDIKDLSSNYVELNKFRAKFINPEFLINYIWVLPESIGSRKYVFNKKESIFRINNYGYLACFEVINVENLNKFINFCQEKEISAIIAWPTFFDKLASFLNDENKYKLKKVQYLESNSEYLTTEQKNRIERIFGIQITNIYSGNETNFISASCNNNKMHLLHNNVFLELIPNQFGYYETIITNLNTNKTPLIRYNLGDVAKWNYSKCSCEIDRLYPFKLYLMNYRNNDYFISKSGEKYEFNIISDPIHFAQIKFNLSIKKYKVIQTNFNKIVLHLYIDKVDENSLKKLKTYMQEYLFEVLEYEVEIEILYGEIIENDKFEGKYKFFESKI